MASFRLKFAGLSDIGMKRSQNQDHFMCVPDLALFIVADGMGGHKGGETASLMAVTTISDYIRSKKNTTTTSGTEKINSLQLVTEAITEANRAIYSYAQKNPELQGMGTTCTTLLFDRDTLYVGHVGDSRAYLIHPHCIWQLTRDHSLVQEKLRAGIITRSQLKTDRMKNVITRSVGYEPNIEVDVYTLKISSGDTFLVCSDGLTGMCDDPEIREIVEKSMFVDKKFDNAPRRLCDAANRNGGDDNVTAVIVNVG